MKAKIAYEPNIDLSDSMVAPDSWTFSIGAVLPDDFVVCRKRNGEVVSRYGDATWDRTHYHPRNVACTLVFNYWGNGVGSPQQQDLAAEMRFLMSILIYKRPGHPLSNRSLGHYISMLREVAKFSEANGCRIQDVLGSRDLLKWFSSDDSKAHYLSCLTPLLKVLYLLGQKEVVFSVPSAADVENILRPIMVRLKDRNNQHPPIPTKIYSSIISALKKELDDWEAVEKRYIALLLDCLKDPFMGRHPEHQKNQGVKKKDRRLDFEAMLRKYDLEAYFMEKALAKQIQGLATGLVTVMEAARRYIIVFRVLKPGGLIRIVVPDLAANVQHYLNGKTRADYFLEGMEILYSTDRTPNPSRLKKLLAPLLEYPHKCYYDASALIEIMDKIGFDAENMKPFESRLPEIRDIEIEGRTQYAIMIEGIKIPEARPIGNSFERELIPLSSMALPNDAESLPGEAVGEPVENKATPVEHT